MSMDIIEIQRHLKKKQSEHRFTHSLGVQYTSICLAMKYGYDLSKAELAGILSRLCQALQCREINQNL